MTSPQQMSHGQSRRKFLAATGAVGTTLLASSLVKGAEEVPLAPPDKQPADLEVPKPVERKIGWAIVGLGQLALEEVMPAFAQCQLSRPVALVSGHADKAKQVAKAYDISEKNIYNYDNYDKLADNRDVDVIYIILPNSMHAEYTIRGVKAGKHVLCEKPMATSVAECEKMIAAADQAKRKLMIAYRLRYEPFNKQVIELCQQKKHGAIRIISASNCQQVAAPNIRLSHNLGGGPLGDVGIYCLNAARYLTGHEPIEVSATAQQSKDDSRFREVPEGMQFTLRFPDNVLAHCDCSFGAAENRVYRVTCTEGVIELDDAFAYRGQQLRVRTKEDVQQFKITPVDHFAAEMDHFSQCVLHDIAPRTPGAEGLADMRIIAAIQQAAESGQSVKL